MGTQGSKLDNEFYDFGNANVISVTPPLNPPYYFTQHTVYMSGAFSGVLRQITLQRNNITSYTSSYTNNNFDDCWSSTNTLHFSNNCLLSKNSNLNEKFVATAEGKKMRISETTLAKKIEIKPEVSNIQSVEIYNTTGQLLKKVNSGLELYAVLRNGKVAGLMPGLYFVRILYKDKTSKTIKQFFQ